MLAENLSETFDSRTGAEARKGKLDALRIGLAALGGILVLNSFLARKFFSGTIHAEAAQLSAAVGAIILGTPILISAIRDLLRGKVYMNELVTLALIAAFADGDYATAGAVAFFMLVTIAIERRTAIGAEASIEALIRLTPKQARCLVDGKEVEVEVLDLQVGDTCRVRPGENLPADGIVINGQSSINQASITGESLPADKAEGDQVYAGTQNLTGLVDIRVTQVGTDTTLGKVKSLIVAAEHSKTPVMRMIDRYVGYYTPTVLMIAAMVFFFTRDMNRVIAVLVMSCPCALVLATPSAIIAAIASASRLGILIKDVAHIELAAKIKAVVFDKTGTLTEGNLEVARLQPAEGVELAELLQVATSTEYHSNHPAAAAMKRLAKEAGIDWEDPQSYTEVAGKGVEATYAGSICRVGRQTWLEEYGLHTGGMTEGLNADDTAGMSVVFVSRDDRVLGWIGLRDAIRTVAKEAITQLRGLGVSKCCMVTGDIDRVAQLVGGKIGITEIQSACLPQDKVAFVEKLKAEGDLVAVVGDGVNDGPALAAGDIGIAMGAIGSDVAVQSASVALMNNDLRRIPFFISLARRTRILMNQNLALGLGFIILGLYFSVLGYIDPVVAAVLHSVGSLMILFNSARLVRAGEELQTQEPRPLSRNENA
jgi:Zn2+/Cd2+-exporting ATPase